MNKLNNKFVIVTAFYNAEPYICQNLHQSNEQSFDDLGILFCDDGSTDNTQNILFDKIGNMVEFESGKAWKGVYGDRPIIYYKNEERNGCPALNQKIAINKYIANTGAICGIVDGDDYLSNPNAVKYVEKTMEDGNYMMYASSPVLIDKNEKKKGIRLSLPFLNPYVSGNPQMRQQGWGFHHFRAFKRVLAENVDTGRSFYDPGGNVMDHASDMVWMRPMFEMAGWEKIKVEPERRFYAYREELATNEHAESPALQNRHTMFCSNAYSGLYFIDGEQEANDFISGYKLYPNYVKNSGVNFSGMHNGKSGYFVFYDDCWHPDGITGCSTPYNILTGI